MRWHAVLVAAGVALLGSGVIAQQILSQDQPFRSGVEVVTIAATVYDEDGRLATGLPRDVFEIYEDGQRREVTQFTAERVPVGVGLALDASDSMFGRRTETARSAVERFLFELLGPDDQYFVLTFNHYSLVVMPWTADASLARARLRDIQPSGGTAVYDAVLAALPLFERRARQRAALVLISDGADTASDASLRQVSTALIRSDAFVYAIAIDPPERRPINTRVNPWALRDITDPSGGYTEVVTDLTELDAATMRIAETLNKQYLLGFNTAKSADGEYHSLRVSVRIPGYRVRARRGYVATPLVKRSALGSRPE
jgi:Ca-activated chloride channel family protein